MTTQNNTQKKKAIGLCIAFVILLLIVVAWYAYQPSNVAMNTGMQTVPASAITSTTSASTSSSATSPYPPPSLGEQNGVVMLGGQTIYVDLAVNPAQQALGLGDRASLGAHQGMLFIFPNDAQHMFWMKDMSFSIDMIWMSADGTVIYIQPNTAPDTYPEAFGPNGVSRYVLEVPANFAATYGITVGDRATLP